MFFKLLAIGAAWCFLVCPSHAQLVWDQPIQEFKKAPTDKQVEAKFAFRNAGKTTVSITSVQTSCGCTTASVDKKTYAPGDKGQIVAVYNFSGHTGALHKTIAVSTDHEPQQVAALEIRVSVNELLQVKPALVYWRIGEAKNPKTVQLIALREPVHIVKATSSNPRFVTGLQVIKAGQQYSVEIAPADTNQKESTQISIVFDDPESVDRHYTIYAMVK